MVHGNATSVAQCDRPAAWVELVGIVFQESKVRDMDQLIQEVQHPLWWLELLGLLLCLGVAWALTRRVSQAMSGHTRWTGRSVTKGFVFPFLALVLVSVLICYRLQNSRIGRAWMAIREDEIAAKAMGINTRNLKLMAFGMGATFGGVAGVMFASFQGFVSPESFSLMESVMIVAMVVLGGLGHLPGVILGAVLLSALPEVLRFVAGPLQAMTDGRLDAAILRQLLIALAMIVIMLWRPRGLWPSPEHGKALPSSGNKL